MAFVEMIANAATKVVTGVVTSVAAAITAPTIATVTTAVVTVGVTALGVVGAVKLVKFAMRKYDEWENERKKAYGNSKGRFSPFRFNNKDNYSEKDSFADRAAEETLRRTEERASDPEADEYTSPKAKKSSDRYAEERLSKKFKEFSRKRSKYVEDDDDDNDYRYSRKGRFSDEEDDIDPMEDPEAVKTFKL